MTVREYIAGKFASFGLTGYESDLEATLVALDAEEELSEKNIRKAEAAFVKRVPEFLLRPSSISELGVSISYASKADLRAYYALKCKELGLRDELSTDKAKVRFL